MTAKTSNTVKFVQPAAKRYARVLYELEIPKADIEKTKENGYLATPSGDLLEYNPYSKKTSIVTSDLPSDPKDPKRKNNINPKDIPAEKGKQRMKELLQKPDLNIPVSQREHIHWVF